MNEILNERLKALQALPLERKVGFTAARIAEFYDHFNGNVYVSFSGGKDSTVLLYIARKLFPNIKAMFIDTGLEYPEIRDFVRSWDNVDWIRPKMSFLRVIREFGFPVISKEVSHTLFYAKKSNGECKWAREKLGVDPLVHMSRIYDHSRWRFLLNAPFKVSDRCCDIMKKGPAHQYEKETGLHPIVATMTEESMLRKTSWLRAGGCNSFSKRPHSAPMSFWLEQDVLRYIKMMNIDIASVYGDIRGGANAVYNWAKEDRLHVLHVFRSPRERAESLSEDVLLAS